MRDALLGWLGICAHFSDAAELPSASPRSKCQSSNLFTSRDVSNGGCTDTSAVRLCDVKFLDVN